MRQEFSKDSINNQQTSKKDNHQFNSNEIQQNANQNCTNFFSDFFNLYKYSDRRQKIAIFFGIIFGIASGVSHPIFIFLWCQQLQLTINNQQTLSEHMTQFLYYLLQFVGLGIGVLIFNSLLFMIWKYVSRSVSKKIRIKYLQHFIHLSVKQIDEKNSYQWANQFKINTLNIQKSIGDKVALLLNLIGIVASGFLWAVSSRWTLTLQILMIVPFGIAILMWFILVQIGKKQINNTANKGAQNKSLQATTMIKTIKMLNGEEKQSNSYNQMLQEGYQQLSSYSWKLGVSTGLFWLIQYLFFGLGSIMGIQCVRGTSFCPVSVTNQRYTLSQYLEVFFKLFFCTFNFLQLGSNYNIVKSGIASSKKIYKFIDDNKIIDQREGMAKPERIGKIQFKDVTFAYPLDQTRIILDHLNITFLEQKFNAIVGATGCGKSTIIQLLLKQYEKHKGQITIGQSTDLEQISTSHWLNLIGIVTQQPILFSGSIRDNILVGKQDATDEEVIQALTQANIYKFIKEKPQQLDFQIGVGGSKLSGGQKQRVAIARALVKKPQLLILDQATSALDRKTEMEIQETLQSIRTHAKQLTIICIAHRLKTIENADKIFVIRGGRVYQQGIYKQMEYFNIINKQSNKKKQEQKIYQDNKSRIIIQNKSNISQISEFNKSIIFHTKNETYIAVQYTQRKRKQQTIYSKLFNYTTYKIWYFICLFLALIIGASHATSGILLSYSLQKMNILYLLGEQMNWCKGLSDIPSFPYFQTQNSCNSKLDDYYNQAQTYLYGLIGFAIFQFMPYFIQVTTLSKIDNEVSLKLRKDLYKKLITLEIKHYDLPQNESGGAASRFGNDSKAACQLLTAYIPILISNFCTVLCAVIICFCYDWRFGLLSMLVTPLIALSFYIAMLFIGGYQDSSLQLMQDADRVANELITTIKTVLMLNYQQRLLGKYQDKIKQSVCDIVTVGGKIGLVYGSAYLILEVVVGLALYLAIIIVKDNKQIQPISVIMFMVVSVLSGFITGNNFYFIAHISISKQSGRRIMELVNMYSQVQLQNLKRNYLVQRKKDSIKGKIQFKNVSFRYRADQGQRLVLDNVSFVINPGQKVGFAGPSGCGKSTILQLILRFYQFTGQILLDDYNIYDYDLDTYRDYFALLNQEPSLFAGSIASNIKYNTDISKETIIDLAKRSCAYTKNENESIQQGVRIFIDKKVGPKGSNISGGQKQRTACARALARQCSIFMMDEGTSALDSNTQKKVLMGIESKTEGKTMINVAHRIETIKNSDIIFAFEFGKIKQMGSYDQLIAKKDYFYNFVMGNRNQ